MSSEVTIQHAVFTPALFLLCVPVDRTAGQNSVLVLPPLNIRSNWSFWWLAVKTVLMWTISLPVTVQSSVTHLDSTSAGCWSGACWDTCPERSAQSGLCRVKGHLTDLKGASDMDLQLLDTALEVEPRSSCESCSVEHEARNSTGSSGPGHASVHGSCLSTRVTSQYTGHVSAPSHDTGPHDDVVTRFSHYENWPQTQNLSAALLVN